MFLVVGLGNPGREHEHDRHNVGFVVIDALARQLGGAEFKSKWNAHFARASLGGHEVVLLKPQTYMNLSGESVQPAAAFFKVPPAEVLVVHDEIDLPFGEQRLKLGGGHAGHNGVRHIIERLGTPEFVRLRVGIGRPPVGFRGDDGAATRSPHDGAATRSPHDGAATRTWVLSGFDAPQRAELPGVVDRATDAIARVVKGGLSAAMNVANSREKR